MLPEWILCKRCGRSRGCSDGAAGMAEEERGDEIHGKTPACRAAGLRDRCDPTTQVRLKCGPLRASSGVEQAQLDLPLQAALTDRASPQAVWAAEPLGGTRAASGASSDLGIAPPASAALKLLFFRGKMGVHALIPQSRRTCRYARWGVV